jgi:hypothetical protein
MLPFEETLGAENVFETGYMVVSIGLLCLVKVCFPLSDFVRLTKVVRQIASPSPCQILEIETIVGLDINDATQFLPKT